VLDQRTSIPHTGKLGHSRCFKTEFRTDFGWVIVIEMLCSETDEKLEDTGYQMNM
jgi:hypothetical protein